MNPLTDNTYQSEALASPSSPAQPGAPDAIAPSMASQSELPALSSMPSQPGAPNLPVAFNLPGLSAQASYQFRSDTEDLERSAQSAIEAATPLALELVAQGSTMAEAFAQVMPDYDNQMWNTVRLEEYDSALGSVVSTPPDGKVYVVTHSEIVSGLYFDTIASEQSQQIVTYNERHTETMCHSGDVITQLSGGRRRLDHTIKPKQPGFSRGVVIVSPWRSRSDPVVVSELERTKGISEIRTCDENGENCRRFIIPMSYDGCGNNTACIAVKLAYDPETRVYSATFCRDYIMGFADDTQKLLEEVARVYP